MRDFLRAMTRPSEGWAPVAAFGSRPSPPPPPAPLPMPDTEDPALLTRRRRELEGAMARSGRLSTMLTDEDSYSRDKLGLR